MFTEDEWSDFVNTPFNPPDDSISDDEFRDEFYETEEALRKVLLRFGEEDDYGEKDFGLDNGFGRTRGSGVELSSRRGLERPEVLAAIRDFLTSLPETYDVALNGMNYDFYLYVNRNRTVAYTRDKRRLGRFGLKPENARAQQGSDGKPDTVVS